MPVVGGSSGRGGLLLLAAPLGSHLLGGLGELLVGEIAVGLALLLLLAGLLGVLGLALLAALLLLARALVVRVVLVDLFTGSAVLDLMENGKGFSHVLRQLVSG